jgi:ATP-dependent DNA helicase RecG
LQVRTFSDDPTPTSSPGQAVESALVALRGLWREGLTTSRLEVSKARRSIAQLSTWAPDGETHDRIRKLGERLEAYRFLDDVQRAEELKALAAAIKELGGGLRVPAVGTAQVGMLNSAIAPGRAPARTTAPPPPPPLPVESKPRTPAAVPQLTPEDPVTKLPAIGPKMAKTLAAHKHPMETVGRVIALAPNRHIDFSRTQTIADAIREMHKEFGRPEGFEVTTRGEITRIQDNSFAKPPRCTVHLSDGTGTLKVTWFNNFMGRTLNVGDELVVSGALETGYGAVGMTSPEWEFAHRAGLSTGRLVPVYPLTKGITQKGLRSLTRNALDAVRGRLYDPLPDPIRRGAGLVPLWDAYDHLHYPANGEQLHAGQRRLAFDDLFYLQLGFLIQRRDRTVGGGIALTIERPIMDAFLAGLPFTLTGAQQKALAEIERDLARGEPMQRLLQGDVGSGKTVVAAAAALIATANGYQAAIMAPTEILAEQHERNLRTLFDGLPEALRPTVGLLTGSTKARARRSLLESLAAGHLNILVGTHAIIQPTVEYDRLAIAVVDEQHRFGVRQRGELTAKGAGAAPHVLAMTATPIPRTLNLVLHGDLEVSVIAERPPGRIPIETRRYGSGSRAAAYDLVRQEVAAGRQVFVICPLVEESEQIEAKAATAEAERLQTEVFPELKVALLHGKMASKQKDAVMSAFRDREADILVATSVIEVGIDVPNATVMMIEGADRFGLAQLHQFRGRVGRGAHQSYCLLLTDDERGDNRLSAMVESDDGFVLAERDLELRGPGDFLGTRQSGLPELSWLSDSFDTRLLDQARTAAEGLLADDPHLSRPENKHLSDLLQDFWQQAGVGITP